MTRHRVDDEQYALLARRTGEVIRRVDEGTIPFESAMRRLQIIIEGRGFENDLIHGLFATPAQQLQMVRALNVAGCWGFTESDFTVLGEPPIYPTAYGPLTVVVLDVSLDTAPQATFDIAWQLLASQQPKHVRWEGLKSDPDHLRLLSGSKYARGLRWRIVDLGCNRGRIPGNMRSEYVSPAAAVLWMGCYSPRWVSAMNGRDIPYVWLSGYEACTLDDLNWQHVPFLHRYAHNQQVRLDTSHCGFRTDERAVPVFRE